MNSLISNLKLCPLFSQFKKEEISDILLNTNHKISSFHENQIIAFEGDPAESIGIILDGGIDVQKTFPSGKTVTISSISIGGIFGEVIIFSNHKKYPSTIIATKKSTIIFISQYEILNLCTNNKNFLNKFMGLLSTKILMLNNKVKNLSYGTIREKLSSFLIDEYKKQKNLVINIKFSRQELADQFAITRPSLSRELIKMRDENLIKFTKKIITIVDLESLEECLF